MASKIGIINTALVRLGVDPITDLSETNRQAVLAKEQYPKVLKELLYDHPWNFAVKYAELAQSATAPPHSWAYAYPLPADCLRLLRITEEEQEFEVVGREIYTDEATLKVMYISEVAENLFTEFFAQLVSMKLAAELSYALVQSVSLTQQLEVKVEDLNRKARTYDAQEDTSFDYVGEDFWIGERF